jgi:ArsR family transcriptional regulator, arsenate/arsenite/antimonite-responsive transcriptional repressor
VHVKRPTVGATYPSARLAELCRALGSPVRLAILRYLQSQHGPRSCGEIVAQLPRAQSTVSRHLQVLRAAGLVVSEAEPPHVRYGVAPEVVDEFQRLVATL